MEKPQIEDILPVEITNFPQKTERLLSELIKKVEDLDLVVNVKEQTIDIQDIVKSIKEIQIPEGKDYSNELQAILTQLEKLNEEEPEKDDTEKEKRRNEKMMILQNIFQAIKEVNTTQDFTPIIELLQIIALKETPEPPFSFDNGRLLVTVDRVSAGGGGLKQSESEALIEIPDKLENVTHLDTHTNESSLAVIGRNHYCEGNSSTTPLGSNAEFTGVWHDFNGYAELTVSVYADKDSATNGLIIEHSNDETDIKTVKDTDTFSVYANAGTPFRITPGFKFVRVRYINGTVAQTKFSLQSVFRVFMTAGSTHRADESIKDNSDAPLSINVLKLKKPNANEWVSAQATTSGNFKVSLEEFENGFQTNPLPIKSMITDEFGGLSPALGDEYFKGAQIVIDPAHHEIHCGDSISTTYVEDLGNGVTRDILIKIPTPEITEKRYHFTFDVVSEGEADVSLYENTTVSADGTGINSKNRNRHDPVVAENEVPMFHTPTVTGEGTLLERMHWGSGRGVGGEQRGGQEWILKYGQNYMLRITNATTTNNYISVIINYYVHPGA
jgi:hypothetical protein